MGVFIRLSADNAGVRLRILYWTQCICSDPFFFRIEPIFSLRFPFATLHTCPVPRLLTANTAFKQLSLVNHPPWSIRVIHTHLVSPVTSDISCLLFSSRIYSAVPVPDDIISRGSHVLVNFSRTSLINRQSTGQLSVV